MRTRYLIMLILACLFQIQFVSSQTNKLYIPPTNCPFGKTTNVEMQMDNQSEVVALQFNLHIPDVVTLDKSGMQLAEERKDDHKLSVTDKGGNNYLVIVMSMDNKPFKNASGALIKIPLVVPDGLEIDKEYPFQLSNVVLSDRSGKNIMTSFDAGKIKIVDGNGPDITPTDIQLSSDNFQPGGKVSLAWNVENIGGKPTEDGWSEQLYLVDESGNEYSLGKGSYNEIIGAKGKIARRAEYNISEFPGIEGKVQAKVVLTAFSEWELPVYRENNEGISKAALDMPKVLTFRMNGASIREQDSQEVFCFFNRSGSREKEEVFTIQNSNTNRLDLPALVKIPANESGVSLVLKAKNDEIANKDSFAILTISGNGYTELRQEIWIEDDEVPALTLIAPEETLQEGQTFNLTVSRPWETKWPLTVKLTTDHPNRFSFDTEVTIPANVSFVTVPVHTVNDDTPDVAIDAVFMVAKSGYETARGFVKLEDDDVPDITLDITPATLAEGAGAQAAIATLRRTKVTNNKITVKLTDTSKGMLYYPKSSITLDTGETEYQFAIGISDNDLQDGDRTVQLTAAVYISSCSCSTAGTSAGAVTKDIVITDNDGPTLKISSSQSALIEGKRDATQLIITRNTSTDQALTVSLSCDRPNDVIFPASVTIPAGESSVTIPVEAKSNETTEGNRTIAFTVTADGFSSGACWAMITDQTLPDAVVSNLQIAGSQFYVSEKESINVTVTNSGATMLPASTKISIYVTDNKLLDNASYKFLAGNLYTESGIEPGKCTILSDIVTLPDKTGKFYLIATINENKDLNELVYTNNNTDALDISLKALFQVKVSVNKTVYKIGESVIISGKAVGKHIANQKVDLYIINEGTRTVVDVITDNSGNFQYTYNPKSWQMGHFSIGACYPDEGLKDEMVSFDILGLRRSSGILKSSVFLNRSEECEIELSNPGIIRQTNITAEVVSAPASCKVSFGTLASIDAGSKGKLSFKVTGISISADNEWEKIPIRIRSAEGSELETVVYSYCASGQGIMKLNTASINSTVTAGCILNRSLTIRNEGLGETGTITLTPSNVSWFKLSIPEKIPSLKSGESANIEYTIEGNEDLTLNVPANANLIINSTNAQGLIIPLSVKKVTGTYGDLELIVCDESTYMSDNGLNVANAKVVVKNATSDRIVSSSTTDANGKFHLSNLPVGPYSCTVSKENHENSVVELFVEAEKTVAKKVMLLYTPITYSWNVVRTEIEDEYELKLKTTFETNVPAPVLIMEFVDKLPFLLPGESALVNGIITNKGLVTAQDLHVNTPKHENYTFETLVSDFEELAPMSSVVVPVKVTRNSELRSLYTSDGGISCEVEKDVLYVTAYKRKCNFETGEWEYYQVYGTLSLPIIKPHCKVIVPNVPTHPIVFDPHNPPTYPVDVPSTPIKPVKQPTGTVPEEKNDEDTNDCRKDCFSDGMDLPKNVKDFAEDLNKAKDFMKKNSKIIANASFRAAAERANLYESAFSVPYGVTKFAMECLLPYINNLSKKFPDQYKRLVSAAQKDVDNLKAANENFSESDRLRELLYHKLLPAPAWFDDVMRSEFIHEALKILKEDMPLPPDNTPDVLKNIGLEKVKDKMIDETYKRMKDSFIDYIDGILLRNENSGENDKLNWIEVISLLEQIENVEQKAVDAGFENTIDWVINALQKVMTDYEEIKPDGCTHVSIQFAQKAVMTREAFMGTLTIHNTNPSNAIESIKLNIRVLDTEGNDCSELFQIEPYHVLDGVNHISGKYSVPRLSAGTFTVLYIPEMGAAPLEAKDYYFTGSLQYINPFSETSEVSYHELYPVRLSVSPSPKLKMTYFVQRDILGDDPLTSNKVEPSVPAEFALLIQNTGLGDVKNLNVKTAQPEIIDNQKGLLINFNLLASTLNGIDKSMALGGNIKTNFGTIPAGQTAYAQWWFTSTLLGNFKTYKVEATHVTSYDNPNLSLLDGEPTIHELIRSIKVPKSDLAGFLVNDLEDDEYTPDMIYLTDGTIETVSKASAKIEKNGDQYTLTATPSTGGWSYGSLTDPTGGRQKLVSIIRQDGQMIDLLNVWQTSCTVRNGKAIYENRIHFADKINGNTTYKLTFEPGPDVILEVASFDGIPANNEVAEKPVTEITVHFNKAIEPETFTTEDLTLVLQGQQRDASPIHIKQKDKQTFVLDLTEVSKLDGFYVLTVQTAGITDYEGFLGESGKNVSWTQYLAPGYQTLSMELASGWNWISTNMEGVSNPVSLLTPVKEKVKRMQSQSQEVTNDPQLGLVGNLDKVASETFYKLEMNANGKIDITGTVLTPSQVEIGLKTGWNWIGYIPRSATTPTKALALLTANVGDEVKGQTGFAQFNGSTWVGTLDKMEPGKGYMYKAAKSQTLQYPIVSPLDATVSLRSVDLRSSLKSELKSPWTVDIHKYPNNMSVIANLWLDEVKQEPDRYVVAAFCGDECRGIGKYVDDKLFITVYGDKTGENITFRAALNGGSSQWKIKETVSFSETTQGTLTSPFDLHLSEQTTGNDIILTQNGIYPNPVSRLLYIKGDTEDIRRVQVVGGNGAVLMKQGLNGGNSIDVSPLSSGLYILVIERNNNNKPEFHKFIKK